MIVKREAPKIPGPYALIPVGKSQFAIVDAEDYPRLSKHYWKLQKSHSKFYAVRKVRRNSKTIYIKMHREVMNAPEGMDVHHINHNTLDNRKKNLQVLTPKEHHAIREFVKR